MSEKRKQPKTKKAKVAKAPSSDKSYLTVAEQTDVLDFLFMASTGVWKCDIPACWKKFAFEISGKLKSSLCRYRAMCEIAEGKGTTSSGRWRADNEG